MLTLTQHRPDAWKYEPDTIGGKHAIVTGGTTGIGRTIALLLASLGAKVLIFGRDEQHLSDALDTMGEYRERVFGLTADVSREQDVERIFQEIDNKLGSLDFLINNAGLPARSVTDTEPDDYRYVVETNLMGYMTCARRAVPRLRERGGGTIINIGSLSAKSRGEGSDIYSATKEGLRGFCDALGKELQDEDIRVTLIEPGNVGADFDSSSPDQQREQAEQGRLLFTESIAEAVVYCLTLPKFAYVPLLQIQPLHQKIGE